MAVNEGLLQHNVPLWGSEMDRARSLGVSLGMSEWKGWKGVMGIWNGLIFNKCKRVWGESKGH